MVAARYILCIRYEDNSINNPTFPIMYNLFVRCLYVLYQEMPIILMIKNYALISSLIRLYLVIFKLFNFFKFYKASDKVVSRYALVGTWTRDLSLTKGVLYRWATRAEKKWAGLDQSRLPAAQ